MADSSDIVPLVQSDEANLGYREGTVISWNRETNANQIRIGNTIINDIPVITTSDIVAINPGDSVAVIKYNSTFGIIGRTATPGQLTNTPWQPVPMYPGFVSNGAAGSLGVPRVNVGVLAAWEGAFYTKSHTQVEVYGVWGQFSGSNSSSYALSSFGITIGTWSETGLVTARRGPFDITQFMNSQFQQLKLEITSSSGSGEVAIAPLGVYLRPAP